MKELLSNLSTTSIIAIVIKYLIEAVVLLAAGYFYGRHIGFDEGFKLGVILAKCRIKLEDLEEDNSDDQ